MRRSITITSNCCRSLDVPQVYTVAVCPSQSQVCLLRRFNKSFMANHVDDSYSPKRVGPQTRCIVQRPILGMNCTVNQFCRYSEALV